MTTLIRRPFTDVGEFPIGFGHNLGQVLDELIGARTPGGSWAPAIDVHRDEREMQITADVPGVEPEQVKISLREGALAISGEHRTEHETEAEDFVRRERHVGTFRRVVPLPPDADIHHVAATTKDGVVTITVPLTAPEPEPVVELTPKPAD